MSRCPGRRRCWLFHQRNLADGLKMTDMLNHLRAEIGFIDEQPAAERQWNFLIGEFQRLADRMDRQSQLFCRLL